MLERNEILRTIKSTVRAEIPDAEVRLFGSRVTGKIHAESDWDILILTQEKYPKRVKWSVYDNLFPISLSIGSVFNVIMITNDEWENAPGYYSLQKGVGNDYILL